MRWLLLLLFVACADDEVDGGPSSTSPFTSTWGGEGVPATRTGLFLSFDGAIDGVPTTFRCEEGDADHAFSATVEAADDEGYALGGVCSVTDSQRILRLELSVVAEAATTSTACRDGFGLRVVDLLEGTTFDCGVHEADTFRVTVNEVEELDDGSVMWGGTVDVSGSGSMEVELAGAYRFLSVP